jgi:hypothetical protein
MLFVNRAISFWLGGSFSDEIGKNQDAKGRMKFVKKYFLKFSLPHLSGCGREMACNK